MAQPRIFRISLATAVVSSLAGLLGLSPFAVGQSLSETSPTIESRASSDTKVLVLPGPVTPAHPASEPPLQSPPPPEQTAPVARALTSAQKAWVLAASALLTESNHERHDSLGGGPQTAAHLAATRRVLRGQWDITDRASLLAVLTALDEEGHRQAFAVVGERVSRLSAEEFQATLAAPGMNGNLAHSLLVARDNYEKLGHRSLIGWDYSRYISLCRWGYLVGSLTEEEAWQRVMHAAQIIQGTFASWRELGENYLIGRDFWSYEATRRDGQIMRATYQELLRKPQSPWNQIPWNLDLE